MTASKWVTAKDPFTAIMRVAKEQDKVVEIGQYIGTILATSGDNFNLADFLAELASVTDIVVQHKALVPEWRATYDQ